MKDVKAGETRIEKEKWDEPVVTVIRLSSTEGGPAPINETQTVNNGTNGMNS